jgi:hypothetical protein
MELFVDDDFFKLCQHLNLNDESAKMVKAAIKVHQHRSLQSRLKGPE